jgi:hypothetical protein
VASNESHEVGALKHADMQAMAKQHKLHPTNASKNSDNPGKSPKTSKE